MRRDPWRVVPVALALLVSALYAVAAPGLGREYFVDQRIDRQTVAAMRRGASYPRAMSDALRRNNGPASSVRAFRTPTIFVLWRWLPGWKATWVAYCAMVALTAILLGRLFPSAVWAVPLVALYLLHFARPHDAHGWSDLYLLVEPWGLPAAVGSMLAWRDGRDGRAALFAVLAVAIRELAAPLLVAGLAMSIVRRRGRLAWASALVGAALFLTWHAVLVHPHLAAHGVEAPLLGTGGFDRLESMVGVGLGTFHRWGIVVWVLAIAWTARRPEGPMVVPWLGLGLTGLAVGRDYWGLLVVPVSLMGAAGAVSEGVLRARAAVEARRA